jgi:uncharacterized protein (TIGR02594 family)
MQTKFNFKTDTPWMEVLAAWEGLEEVPGNANNPDIINMFAVAGHAEVKSDATAWCSALENAIFYYANMPSHMTHSLLARSWLDAPNMEKVPLSQARFGDIIIMKRGNSSWQGHVTNFVRWVERGETFKARGGNQNDMINTQTYSVGSVIGVRRPIVAKKPDFIPPLPEPKPEELSPAPLTPAPSTRTVTWSALFASAVAGLQQNSWIVAAVGVLLVCAVVGFVWWRNRK